MIDIIPLLAGNVSVCELSDEVVRQQLRHIIQVHRQIIYQNEMAYRQDRSTYRWLETVSQKISPS